MRYKLFLVFVLGSMLFFTLSVTVSAQSSNDLLFPDTTQGFVEMTSIDAFKTQWQKTKIGALLKDPVMQPACEEVQKQIDAKWLHRLGLTLDDVQMFPTGLISGGMIAVPGAVPGFVLVISVKDQSDETVNFMQQLGKKLENQGVKKATTPIESVTATYFTFEKTEKNPQGGIAVYLLAKDTLVITDRQHLAAMMVKRLNGDLSAPLRDKPAYKAVMERVTRDARANNALPLLKWYIEPLEFTAAMRMISDNNAPKKKGLVEIDAYELLATHGFKDILGVGGILDLTTDNTQLAYRMKAYAPQPRTGAALKMLSFVNSTDFVPPKWLPEDAARLTILYIEPQKIFENIGPIFDDIVNEPGVWEAVLDGFKNDPYGPKIDIEKALINHLGDRLELMTRFEKPITPDSSRFVAALTLKPGKDEEVAQAFEKLFSGGQDANRIERNGFVYWQSLPEGMARQPASQTTPRSVRDRQTVVPRGGTPPRTTVPPQTRTTPGPNEPEADGEKDTGAVARELFFDKGGLVVGKGHIFISNNLENLYAIMDATAETSFDTSKDFLGLTQTLKQLDSGNGERFLQIAANSSELIMPTYELARQGKMPESQTILGAALRAVIARNEGQRVTDDFDRSTLPPFEKIKSYFGTAGSVGTVESDGWLIEGVQLP
ncbi:MAG: hypothetical protein FWD31_00410 [Planctomycetaceae bacterium]|nr:hypothetical protein [Planctomycetaceae bacterium]